MYRQRYARAREHMKRFARLASGSLQKAGEPTYRGYRGCLRTPESEARVTRARGAIGLYFAAEEFDKLPSQQRVSLCVRLSERARGDVRKRTI